MVRVQKVLTSHVCEFFTSVLQIISIPCLDGILNRARNGIVGAQDRALNKLDFSGSSTLQAIGSTTGRLSLSPCLGRAGLAPTVWRCQSLRNAVARSASVFRVRFLIAVVACLVRWSIHIGSISFRQSVR